MTENWHTWYTGGADFECRLRFLKSQPQNPFLGKFRPKKFKLFVLPKNWHTWYVEDVNSYFNISFQNFYQKSISGQICAKNSKLSILPENWHTWYLENADSYFKISFLNFQPNINFWANVGQKTRSCAFCLKIGTNGILRMWILIPTLVF